MTPLFAIVVVAATLGLLFFQRKRQKQYLADNTDKTVGSLATRLGLAVQEGDPSINLLMFQQPAGDFQRTIRMAGRPYGRPVEFLIADGQKTEDLLVVRRIRTTYVCMLEVKTQIRLVPFEVALRNPNQYLQPALGFGDRQLPEISTGNPMLDATFVVRAADPRMGPALAGALTILASHQYVHLAGDGDTVWTSFSRFGLPYFSYAPEEILLALESAACGLEGRPAPAQALSSAPAPALGQHA